MSLSLGNSVSLSFLRSLWFDTLCKTLGTKELKSCWWHSSAQLGPSGDVECPRTGCWGLSCSDVPELYSDVPELYTPHCPPCLAGSSCPCFSDGRVEVGEISGARLLQPLTSSLWRKENHLFKLSAITTCSCLALCASRQPYLNV